MDMDLIPKTLPQATRRATRKALLLKAAQSKSPSVCWFSTAAPTVKQRMYWHEFVPISQTIIFALPINTVLERQIARDGEFHHLTQGVFKWYNRFEPPGLKEPNTLLITEEGSTLPHL